MNGSSVKYLSRTAVRETGSRKRGKKNKTQPVKNNCSRRVRDNILYGCNRTTRSHPSGAGDAADTADVAVAAAAAATTMTTRYAGQGHTTQLVAG